jgi:hypothetical protein
MTVNIANNTANTNAVSYLVARVNELATALKTLVVTTNSNTTSGNSVVNGTFQALTLVANAIGGSATINANGSIGAAANLTFTTNVILGANAYVTGQSLFTGNVTANNVSVNGSLNAVNVLISGTFAASNLSVNALSAQASIKIGTGSANITIASANSTLITDGNYFLSANGSWVYKTPALTNNSVTTTGTSTQVIDSYSKASGFMGAEFLIYVTDNVSNNKYLTKILALYDGGVNTITEFGSIIANTDVGVFQGTTNVTHVILNFTPVSANTTVKYTRLLI